MKRWPRLFNRGFFMQKFMYWPKNKGMLPDSLFIKHEGKWVEYRPVQEMKL